MNRQQTIRSLIIVPIIAALIAFAGSQSGQTINGYPIFAIAVLMAFGINYLAFIPANILQTEKFFDLTGSLTYIIITLTTLSLVQNMGARSMLLATLIMIWAVRLGTFLFTRVMKDGKDRRFDSIKPNFLRFLNTWSLQALWVTLTATAALIAITSTKQTELDIFAYIGGALWLIGFLMEVAADYQKRQFKKDPANDGQFIQTGLWSKSRHPNYFGEILLWIGIFVIAIPTLQGWQWVALLSPIFVYLLLTRISGLPMLENHADKKWGGQEAYETYKKNTPILIPKF